MATIVDLLENFLGEELSPRVVPLARRLSSVQLRDLIDAMFEFSRSQHPPSGEAEPLIALIPHDIGYNEIAHMGGAAPYIESITNQLLYYPRVHLFHEANPFMYVFTKQPWEALDEFVKIYADLRSLIQSGTVVITSWPDPARTDPYIRELNMLASNDPELVALVNNIAAKRPLPGKMDADAVIDEYHITQVIATETGTSWTAAHRTLLDIHEFQLSRTNQFISSAERVELRATELFGGLQLPAVGKLAIDDLLRIRKEEEAFVEWRQEMAAIARSVLRDEQASEHLFSREFSEQAREKLTPRVSAIREKMKGKSFKQHARDAAIGFVAGITTAITVDPPVSSGGLSSAIEKPLVGGAAGLLLSLFTKRITSKDQLMYRFYSLFEEPSPT